MEIRKGVFVTGIYENLPLDKGERSLRRDPLLVPTIGDFLVFRYMPMLQALQDATRASVRFARRHRRAIVVGGVVGATAYAYHMMRTAVKKVCLKFALYYNLFHSDGNSTCPCPLSPCTSKISKRHSIYSKRVEYCTCWRLVSSPLLLILIGAFTQEKHRHLIYHVQMISPNSSSCSEPNAYHH